jgi:hypothetical protein
MPFILCSACGLTTYSARLWVTTADCPRCGGALPTADRARRLAASEPAKDPQQPSGPASTSAGVLLGAAVVGRPSLIAAAIEALRRLASAEAANRPR